MADDYIDYLECLEYGEAFCNEATKLSGTTNLVDIAALKAHVQGAMSAVATELEKQGVNRSGARIDRKDVDAKTSTMRKSLEKFYHFVNSLDDDANVDVEAFFKGMNLGALAALKPADVAQRAGEVIRGFAANPSWAAGSTWKTRLEGDVSGLVNALAGKGSSTGTTIQGTSALMAARENFLVAYNGVAKKLIGGVLTSVGRKDELKLYFKDLQVNESGRSSSPEASPAADPGSAPKDG